MQNMVYLSMIECQRHGVKTSKLYHLLFFAEISFGGTEIAQTAEGSHSSRCRMLAPSSVRPASPDICLIGLKLGCSARRDCRHTYSSKWACAAERNRKI